MNPRDESVRFCNNPTCEKCDVFLRPSEILTKGGEEVCPNCLEPLVFQRVRPVPPLLAKPPETRSAWKTAPRRP